MLLKTSQIKKCLSDIPHFIGVYPSDLLPRIHDRPAILVVNTDPSTENGEHWNCIWLNDDNTAIFFNSFGLPPVVPNVASFLKREAPAGLQYCNVCLQSETSTMCGYYCIAFARHMDAGGTLSSFVSQFTHQTGRVTMDNDKILTDILIRDSKLPGKRAIFSHKRYTHV